MSKNRKVNVSVIVISTPAYNGILKKTKCYHIQNVIIQKRLGENFALIDWFVININFSNISAISWWINISGSFFIVKGNNTMYFLTEINRILHICFTLNYSLSCLHMFYVDLFTTVKSQYTCILSTSLSDWTRRVNHSCSVMCDTFVILVIQELLYIYYWYIEFTL